MIATDIDIKSLRGVGDVSIKFNPDSNVFVLTGSNGVGKTKSLEAIFQALFFTNENVGQDRSIILTEKTFLFSSMNLNEALLTSPKQGAYVNDWYKSIGVEPHQFPVVYLGAQLRGNISTASSKTIKHIGTFDERRTQYFKSIVQGMALGFESLGMDTPIESWFSNLANTGNPYQRKEDDRSFEIPAVLRILNRIDSRIDSKFIEISGNGNVIIKIDGLDRELSHLSSGFSSILKIVQAIISGYGNFTNETNIEKVKGFVLIDEVESHLHLSWQTRIIPLLSEIFPNTRFMVSTHSPLACMNLVKGQVYELSRGEGGVVATREVKAPKNSMLVDIISDAFGEDINLTKLDNIDLQTNSNAQKALLDLITAKEDT